MVNPTFPAPDILNDTYHVYYGVEEEEHILCGDDCWCGFIVEPLAGGQRLVIHRRVGHA